MAGSGGTNASTHFIGSVAYSDNTTYSYTYDAVGNITEIKKNGTTIRSYVYDELNQLIRENNHELLQYVYYTYDYSGNTQSKTSHYWAGSVIEETTYTYGNTQWGDLLTNCNGTAISYDASGNPLNWRNAAILNWQGRRLNSMALDSGYIHGLDFKYNADGFRTQKSYFDHSTANMYSVSYTLDGTKILAQTYKHSTTGETYTVKFFYDANDAPIAMEYDGNYYYYRTNIQGDIEGIYNTNGALVVSYSYDAWGNILSATGTLASTVGEINPFRYRGYYYDTETGLYYVSSRYYDPEIGRFLNSDDPMFLGATGNIASYNLLAYCENNPVNYKDPSGYGPVGTIIGGILGFGLGALLVPRVADLLKLKGWGRKVFIWAGVAALTGLGAYVGNYVGEAIFAVYKAGGAFAAQINKAIAKGISKLVGGTLKSASGNGWVINIKKIVVRVMTSSNYRNNYFKISVAGKAAYDILGNVSSDPAKIHIPITFNSIIKLVQLIFKLK